MFASIAATAVTILQTVANAPTALKQSQTESHCLHTCRLLQLLQLLHQLLHQHAAPLR